MSTEPNSQYRQLEAGYEFPPVSYQMEADMVSTYLKAVEDTSRLYQATELVPPMAVAAYAMTALAKSIVIPPGTIHINQELEFLDTVSIGDTITCRARVSRNQQRGRLHLLTIDLNVSNRDQKAVLAGKTTFILPEDNGGNRQ